jgi:hypothetical protein
MFTLVVLPSNFSILLSSLPSHGTATTEGRNFGVDHLEGPSAAEPQFYNSPAIYYGKLSQPVSLVLT